MGITPEGLRARGEARATGAKRYFTGLPCRRGHVAERQTVNGTCVECLKLRAEQNPHWFEWGEHNNALKRKRRERIDVKEARKAERQARLDYIAQRTPKWADTDAIQALYNAARRMTRKTGVSWSVDHIIPLRGELVSGLHVLENLQMLPTQDNVKKGRRFDH